MRPSLTHIPPASPRMAGQGVSNHESTVNAAGYERLPAPTPDGLADAEAQLLDDTTVEELCEHV